MAHRVFHGRWAHRARAHPSRVPGEHPSVAALPVPTIRPVLGKLDPGDGLDGWWLSFRGAGDSTRSRGHRTGSVYRRGREEADRLFSAVEHRGARWLLSRADQGYSVWRPAGWPLLVQNLGSEQAAQLEGLGRPRLYGEFPRPVS